MTMDHSDIVLFCQDMTADDQCDYITRSYSICDMLFQIFENISKVST